MYELENTDDWACIPTGAAIMSAAAKPYVENSRVGRRGGVRLCVIALVGRRDTPRGAWVWRGSANIWVRLVNSEQCRPFSYFPPCEVTRTSPPWGHAHPWRSA